MESFVVERFRSGFFHETVQPIIIVIGFMLVAIGFRFPVAPVVIFK